MIKCSSCGVENPMTANFCEACGSSFADIQDNLREADLEEAELLHKQTRAASTALFVVGGLTAAQIGLELVGAPESDQMAIGVVAAVIIGAVFGLAFWARRNPLAASATTLVIFGIWWLADAVLEPASIFRGILIKVIIVVVLVRAIKAALRFRELKAEGRIS